MTINDKLKAELTQQPYPLLFATISGAHLYGFPSADSDYDVRGVHILPASEVLGLLQTRETIEISKVEGDLEFDVVTHDAAKFFNMLLKRNGYVMEQLYSPLILHTTSAHTELKTIAQTCLTRHHAHHYLGFSRTQWNLFNKQQPYRVKTLLYVYRVLLTGIHLLQTGEIEANLLRLNEQFQLSYLPDLIAQKTAGTEKGNLTDIDIQFHEQAFNRLTNLLETERDRSHLPEQPAGRKALSDLLVRLRLGKV